MNRPMLAGVEVREEDIEPQKGLHVAATVFRVASVIILVLALWQFVAWWMDQPPGGAGLGVLVGDTIRLVVFSGLLWAAGDLAGLIVRAYHELRASRILLARQTYMMRQMGITSGKLPTAEAPRRTDDPEDVGVSERTLP